MQDFLNFLNTNKRLIFEIVILIISVVVFILRKRQKNILIDNSASSTLIKLIKEAEQKFGSGHGEDKLSYVICQYFDILKIPANDQHWLYLIVKDIVESILSTPKKKG